VNVLRLTLRQLQIFVAVARTGSTTAASEEIALSQSATSAAVNELERLLSLRLFDRVGKRLLLNDNGRALLPRAFSLLDGVASIEQMAYDDHAQVQALRIGASTTIGNYVLPKLLGRFLGARDRAKVAAWRSKVAIANTEVICAAVAAFELDVGLIEGTCHEPLLEAMPWLRDEMVIVAAPDVVRALTTRSGERLSIKTLRNLIWLLREPGSGTRQATDDLLLSYLHAYRHFIELGSSEAIKRTAAEGIGVACLSHWVVDDLIGSGKLSRIKSTLPALTRQCYLLVHRDKQPTQALLHFLEIARSADQTMRATAD